MSKSIVVSRQTYNYFLGTIYYISENTTVKMAMHTIPTWLFHFKKVKQYCECWWH